MKRSNKIALLTLLFIVSLIILFILFNNNLMSYAIVAITVSFVLLIVLILYIINSRDKDSIYKSEINNILKTYDAILVKSSSLPSLEDRNIIRIDSMQDLINAQIEIRKPIYYKMQVSCCSFLLLDEKEALVFIMKSNDDIESELELLIKEASIVKNKKIDDYSIFKNIEKTAIIMLENSKAFKVSPIREKEKKKEEEEIEILE